MSRVLVVCYSRSGRTRAVGAAIARRLEADFEAVAEPEDRAGPIGYARAIIDTVFGRTVRVDAPRHEPACYELVVIGTPVWAGTASAPVRSWILANRRKLPYVAFFCTEHMRGESTAFRDMTAASGKQPVARCAIRGNPGAEDERRMLDAFADRIRRKLARIDKVEWVV